MNTKVEDGKVKCKCGCQNFRVELEDGGMSIKLSCTMCALDIGSKYVKEEMLYYSKRDGYREALGEVEEFVNKRQENDMV